MKYEDCKFCIDGCCYALACYSARKCEAKQGKSEPVCMATTEEILKKFPEKDEAS